MTEVKVNFYLKRNEEKADGTDPVLGRIRIGKSMVQFSSVPVSLWDTTSGRATGKSKTATSVNAVLDKLCVAILCACRDLLAEKENVYAVGLDWRWLKLLALYLKFKQLLFFIDF